VHSIAIDSKGNLFTTETYGGRRIQKFLYKGMARHPRRGRGSGLAEVVTSGHSL